MFRWMTMAAVVAALAPSGAQACLPQGMLKMVIQELTPTMKAADAPPRTLYRMGFTHARMEEPPNPANGARVTTIVAEPDIWVVSSASKTGTHAIDPGPVLEVHIPIFQQKGVPPVFQRLEFGCERVFLDTYAPRPREQVQINGVSLARHQVVIDDNRLEILMQADGRPFSSAYYKGDAPVVMVRYLEFSAGLPADMSLFAKPQGVVFAEPARAGTK